MGKVLKTSFEIMKRLKVKSSQLLFLMFTFFCSLNVNAAIVSHCFSRPIQVKCVQGMDDKFSLEGEYTIEIDGENKNMNFFQEERGEKIGVLLL